MNGVGVEEASNIKKESMGLTTSHQHELSAAELQAHQNSTGLSLEQLEQLHMRFLALDRSQRGYLTPTELLRIPQLAQNPLHRQIIDGFFADTDCRDRIYFGQFVRTCATFLVPPSQRITSTSTSISPNPFASASASQARADGRAQKLRLLSKMFDTQRRGHIERADFRKIMMSLVDGPPPSDGVENVHAHTASKQELETLEELAFGAQQSVSYELFEQRLSTANVESKLAVRMWLDEEQTQDQGEEGKPNSST